MEYKIVTADTIMLLEHKVNEYIQEGWTPQGGIQYMSSPWFSFAQPMVKISKNWEKSDGSFDYPFYVMYKS
jgi:hypothetical protein